MERRSESGFVTAFRTAWEEGNRAWNDGDMKRAYAALTEDVEYRLAPSWPTARPLHGKEEVVEFFADLRETFTGLHADGLEVVQVNDSTFIAGSRVTGSGASSSVGTEMEIWQVWELGRDLVPLRVTEFLDRSAALAAANAGATEEQSAK
jgi:ketosteroid isomerase-like protein